MSDEEGVGVDTGAADQAGSEVGALAQRYASITADFRAELSVLSEASVEMPVRTGALDYCATGIEHLTRLQAHTGALGASAQAGAAAARTADIEVGTGLATIFAT